MDFMENVTEDLVLDPDGDKYIKIVEAIDGTDITIILKR